MAQDPAACTFSWGDPQQSLRLHHALPWMMPPAFPPEISRALRLRYIRVSLAGREPLLGPFPGLFCMPPQATCSAALSSAGVFLQIAIPFPLVPIR